MKVVIATYSRTNASTIKAGIAAELATSVREWTLCILLPELVIIVSHLHLVHPLGNGLQARLLSGKYEE